MPGLQSIATLKVRLKLEELGTLTTYEERKIIYRLLFKKTGARVPNHAIDMVSNRTLQNIVEKAKKVIEKEEEEKKQRKLRWLRRHLA